MPWAKNFMSMVKSTQGVGLLSAPLPYSIKDSAMLIKVNTLEELSVIKKSLESYLDDVDENFDVTYASTILEKIRNYINLHFPTK